MGAPDDERPGDEKALYRVDTIPPPDGESDAYNAPTKVGPMPAQVLEEMKKAALDGRPMKPMSLPSKPTTGSGAASGTDGGVATPDDVPRTPPLVTPAATGPRPIEPHYAPRAQPERRGSVDPDALPLWTVALLVLAVALVASGMTFLIKRLFE